VTDAAEEAAIPHDQTASHLNQPLSSNEQSIQTRSAHIMQQLLHQFTEGTVDAAILVKQIAGKLIDAFELRLAVSFFCYDNGLSKRVNDVLLIAVPEDQHQRLKTLMEALDGQFNA
jgi:hypothetical protein